ncbi:hypothetical protein [Thermococcus gorgonarius]|uniref:Uncharacterized protein n=1 Tax=Thermococcus gorgonarius TaxID=71997 RepID=A0A2Z2M4W5_THEGO|nr:hypothetical protein [Thermococcus gorgonarius]ASJ00083.1 hypothetical protein A3K92_00570 [Thermococcus gorgonarius]
MSFDLQTTISIAMVVVSIFSLGLTYYLSQHAPWEKYRKNVLVLLTDLFKISFEPKIFSQLQPDLGELFGRPKMWHILIGFVLPIFISGALSLWSFHSKGTLPRLTDFLVLYFLLALILFYLVMLVWSLIYLIKPKAAGPVYGIYTGTAMSLIFSLGIVTSVNPVSYSGRGIMILISLFVVGLVYLVIWIMSKKQESIFYQKWKKMRKDIEPQIPFVTVYTLSGTKFQGKVWEFDSAWLKLKTDDKLGNISNIIAIDWKSIMAVELEENHQILIISQSTSTS